MKKEPTDFGFQRHFGHLSGACNYFRGDRTFRLSGQPWKVPDAEFYTTVADVDFALQFLQEARSKKKPWYLYVAFNASVSLPDSTGWAWARNSPFRYYKQNQLEGGVSTPAIVHWPANQQIPTCR